jgi:rhomboid protease GluP
MFGLNYLLTYLIIFVNSFIFLLTSGNSGRYIVSEYLKNDAAVDNGEYYRLFTSTFLHGGVLHIFANMYSLYSLRSLESIFGPFGFLTLYIGSGISGSFLSYTMRTGNSLGASGSISGLLGSALFLAFSSGNYSLIQSLMYVIVVNIVIGIMPGSNIDNWAHLGGFLGGIFITMLLSLFIKN